MEDTKEYIYPKVYTELNELIRNLSISEQEKIPLIFKENLKRKMDKRYNFKYDISKTVSEQNFLPQTRAMIIEMYIKYLCPEEEKEKWKKYDKYCYEKIEVEKREKYNPDNLFSNKNLEEESFNIAEKKLAVLEKENIFQKILQKIKSFFTY